MGLGEAYDSVAEVDKAGGLFFEWWDGIKDVKHGEVSQKSSEKLVSLQTCEDGFSPV
jgi:hypothetical protein